MSVRLYADHNIPAAVVRALAAAGVDIVSAAEDGRTQERDEELLERSTSLGRVLVTHDADFIEIAIRLQREGGHFAGVVFLRPQVSIGELLADLRLVAQAGEPADFVDRLQFLPWKRRR